MFDCWTQNVSYKVPSQCLCPGGFKFPHHTRVCWILRQDWLPNYLWCYKSSGRPRLFKKIRFFSEKIYSLTLEDWFFFFLHSWLKRCTCIIPHSEAQTLSCRNRKENTLDWRRSSRDKTWGNKKGRANKKQQIKHINKRISFITSLNNRTAYLKRTRQLKHHLQHCVENCISEWKQ